MNLKENIPEFEPPEDIKSFQLDDILMCLKQFGPQTRKDIHKLTLIPYTTVTWRIWENLGTLFQIWKKVDRYELVRLTGENFMAKCNYCDGDIRWKVYEKEDGTQGYIPLNPDDTDHRLTCKKLRNGADPGKPETKPNSSKPATQAQPAGGVLEKHKNDMNALSTLLVSLVMEHGLCQNAECPVCPLVRKFVLGVIG